MIDWRTDEATTQTIVREMNEWTQEREEGTAMRGMGRYLCECGDPGCAAPIALTSREYEAVRSVPVRFVIVVNHENPEVDLVVSECARYAVVEKVPGAQARMALASDPRR